MSDIFKSIQDGINAQKEWIEKSIVSDIIKAFSVGTIHFWGNKVMQKQGDGKWIELSIGTLSNKVKEFDTTTKLTGWLARTVKVIDATNLPLNSRKFIYKPLVELKLNYNKASSYLDVLGKNIISGDYAKVVDGEIWINEKYFVNLVKLNLKLDGDINKGYHPNIEDKAKYLFSHEYSHILTYNDIKDKNKPYPEFVEVERDYRKNVLLDVKEIREKKGALKELLIPIEIELSNLTKSFFLNEIDQDEYNKSVSVVIVNKDRLNKDIQLLYKSELSILKGNKDFVSLYSEENLDEFVAECFSMSLDKSCINKYALKIKQIIDKNYKK